MKKHNGIAIIGMAGRYPQANSPQELWKNIIDDNASNPSYTLNDIDLFDNQFFGYSPYEAALMDPQHRLFLKCAKEALEDAGYEKEPDNQKIGVFACSSISTYLLNNLINSEHYKKDEVNYHLLAGNDKDFLATKVSYKLNLTGPSINIQTACSSSMVAAHYACLSLNNDECEIALVGGVSLSIPQEQTYRYKEGGILSRDGYCRPFDAKASGTVKGNGCSVIVLRKLAKAIAARDRIYSVISATAINNDGDNKIGYYAPGVTGESKVICEALNNACLSPNDIDYIEAHGTGTALGDPIEIQALQKIFDNTTKKIPVGSIKANIGHLDVAAGLTAIIKATYILNENRIPKLKHYSQPNPAIKKLMPPFEFLHANQKKIVNHVSINSFGIGGTNAHVIISKHVPSNESERSSLTSYLIPMYLDDMKDLLPYIENIKHTLTSIQDFRDFVFSMALGKKKRNIKLAILANNREDFLQKLLDHEFVDMCVDSVNFESLYNGMNWHRTRLPYYPLSEKSFWINPVVAQTDKTETSGKTNEHLALTDITERLTHIFISATGEKHIPIEKNMFDLGIDSLSAIDIADQIFRQLKVKLTIDELTNNSTIMKLAAYIKQRTRKNENCINSIRQFHDKKTAIFLFPPAGGTNFCYNNMNRFLQHECNIFSVSFPENYLQYISMEEFANFYVRAIKQFNLCKEQSLILGGYSFGGNIAYEIASQLERENINVNKIIMFDSHPPDAYNAWQGEIIPYQEILPDILSIYFDNKIIGRNHNLYKNMNLEETINVLKDQNIIANLSMQTVDIIKFFKIWTHNHDLLKKHKPTHRLDANLVMISANEPENVAILEKLQIKLEPKQVWKNYLMPHRKFVNIATRGNHYSMFGDINNVKLLAKLFDHILVQDY